MTNRTLASGLLAGALAAAAATGAVAADPIKIGFAISLSGRQSVTDTDGYRIAQMWIEKQNAAGGLLGRQIEFFTADNKTDLAESVKAGQQVLREDPDLVAVSCDYDFGAPAAVQVQKAGKISVFQCAVDPKAGVVGVGPYAFSAGIASQLDGAVIADWALERKDLKKAFVLEDVAGEAQKSACAGFKWNYEREGGEIVGWEQFRFDDASIASQVSEISNAIANEGAQTVMLCSHLGAGGAVRQIRAAGIDVPLLGPSMFDGVAWTSAVPGLTEFYIPTAVVIEGDARPEVQALTDAFAAKYGDKPSSMFAYPIYAWLELWAKAVEAVGTTDSAKVVAEMNTYADEPTTLGPRSFSPELHIQTSMPMQISEFTDGRQVLVEEWKIDAPIPQQVLYRIGG
ncbi:ABC transporter substrate-binding protein [Poseidonocella sp. HB161398]|uniref:ABC transporter substrate-binding protein n=1 Tax=Poseidonocella sp. HB161398 TaxID=2320855 RepID=UPI0014869BB5|nr:ABC transporter substrate-binding protein [Poseidonocella sp. HB161398]